MGGGRADRDSGGAPLPDAVLLRRPAEVSASPAPLAPTTVCCLRSTTAGSRAVVYRTTSDQGVVAVFDFDSDAVARPEGGWAARGVLQELRPPLPRAALLADHDLRGVFAHLQGRRRLPVAAGRALVALLEVVPPFATVPTPGAER